MNVYINSKNYLGINGLGRIGKLNVWNHLALRHFDGVVINVGREVGKQMDDIIQVLETDSTYGNINQFLYGQTGSHKSFEIIDTEKGILSFDGFYIKILRNHRNPRDVDWRSEGVRIVVDCTGVFVDPTVAADNQKGSLRGHLEGGAQKVILSAPFKIKDSALKMPADSKMFVYGINHIEFDAARHHVISSASCTTTGLSHMMLPLLETQETSKMLTASMSTVHAATNSQSVLDAVPKASATDLRKTRSVLNNIILSTTGAAKALEKILPQITEIGFMADSVRIPTNTVSLIILNITFDSGINSKGEPIISKAFLNSVYERYAQGPLKDLLIFSSRQNVSADLIGRRAAVTIEGFETHTRTGFIHLSQASLAAQGVQATSDMNLPVTHAKIFGWYDNEFGSYVNCLGKLTVYVDKNLK